MTRVFRNRTKGNVGFRGCSLTGSDPPERSTDPPPQVSRDDLTALIVHDLKNPLTTIAVNADYLAQAPLPPEEVRVIALEIRDATETMNQLILNLLDVARGEDGALVAHPVEVEIGGLLHEICDRVRRMAEDTRHRIVAESVPSMTVQVDPNLIRRLLNNLLDNAIKYAPAGSPIVVGARRSETALELRVSDQGKGIPPEARERIFEKYTRLRDAPAQRTSRGLGLVFCRLAAEAHGGQIWIEDQEPTGTTFCVRLPIVPRRSFDVYVDGTLDATEEAVRLAARHVAARLVGSPEHVIDVLTRGPVRVRASLSAPMATKLVRVLREAGVRALRVPSEARAPGPEDFPRNRESRGPAEHIDDITTARVRAVLGTDLDDPILR